MHPAVTMIDPDFRQTRKTRSDELQGQIGKMFRRLRMAVIFAGDKSSDGAVLYPSSNPRSWKSYETVAHDIADALRRIGCRHVSVVPEDMHLGERLGEAGTHLAWLNSGGVQGYSSVAHAASMLEMLGVPYIGHDPLVAAMLDNKHAFKRQLRGSGLPTAPFVVWHPSCYARVTDDPAFQKIFSDWPGAYIVKPVSGRASLNVNYVENAHQLQAVAEDVFAITDNHVLVEGYLPGREYCIAVCGPVIARNGVIERLEQPFTFGGLERTLDKDEKIFTSMDIRPITSCRARPLDENSDAEISTRLSALARDVYATQGLQTLVRLDVRADASGELFILEANPKPDLKAPSADQTSLISIGLAAKHMSYDDLIFSILADRVDSLFAQSRGSAERLRTLI